MVNASSSPRRRPQPTSNANIAYFRLLRRSSQWHSEVNFSLGRRSVSSRGVRRSDEPLSSTDAGGKFRTEQPRVGCLGRQFVRISIAIGYGRARRSGSESRAGRAQQWPRPADLAACQTFKAKLLPCNTREWTGCPWGRTEAQSDGSLTQPSAAYAGTIEFLHVAKTHSASSEVPRWDRNSFQ
jgi:hypothetical protein